MPFPLSPRRILLARLIAISADALQIGIFPFFFEGFLSPFNIALDLAVAAALTLLVGWHIAFLPSFLVEQLPFADLAPTWTLAILIATRRSSPPSAEPLPPPRPRRLRNGTRS